MEHGVEVIGFANGATHEYVMFQHGDDAEPLHFEFNDQSNGAYACVSSVRFDADGLTIFASQAPDGLRIDYAGAIDGKEKVVARMGEVLDIHGVEVIRL